ncbi:MAG: hypothetical protein LBI62_00365 [Candidatus Accumulibacter sp.]|jgi:hypothetical protein|nr:hypothetical protein [Accumulibacter sp.]
MPLEPSLPGLHDEAILYGRSDCFGALIGLRMDCFARNDGRGTIEAQADIIAPGSEGVPNSPPLEGWPPQADGVVFVRSTKRYSS